jgi:hypothetical protein
MLVFPMVKVTCSPTETLPGPAVMNEGGGLLAQARADPKSQRRPHDYQQRSQPALYIAL